MSDPTRENRAYLVRLWLPAIFFAALLLVPLTSAARSGDLGGVWPILFLLLVAGGSLAFLRVRQTRRFANMLRQPDPLLLVEWYKRSVTRLPHGQCLAAASSATTLALYGKTADARRELDSASWGGVPPLIEAQRMLALSMIAYVSGDASSGLESAKSALYAAGVSPRLPGVARSELAFRTYRSLGLTLLGHEEEGTHAELQTALERLPLLGKLIAAWALALLAKRQGDSARFADRRGFIQSAAPYFEPVLRSVDSA